MTASSQTIAGDGVADRQREEADGGGHQDDVQHGDTPSDEKFGMRSVWPWPDTFSTYVKKQAWAPPTHDYLSLMG